MIYLQKLKLNKKLDNNQTLSKFFPNGLSFLAFYNHIIGIVKLGLLILVVLIYTACTSLPKFDETTSVLISREQISEFQIDGRIAITHQNQGFQSNYYWQQKNGKVNILFAGPMGFSLGKIIGDINPNQNNQGQFVFIPAGDTYQKLFANSLEELINQVVINDKSDLGVSLPSGIITDLLLAKVDKWEQWRKDQNTQINWEIEYSDKTRELAQEYQMPEFIKITTPEISVRIFIKNWQYK